MDLTSNQLRIINQVINVAETGSLEGNYSAIAIFNDGPHDIKQITYGKAQTTEFGNLRLLIEMYIKKNGLFSSEFKNYVQKIGLYPSLYNDIEFLYLLKKSAQTDPVMRQTQDDFFEKKYLKRALEWSTQNGFKKPLSALIIYDSFIHSGSILWLIRNRFDELPPNLDGDETKWITEYTQHRHEWLANHPRKAVRNSKYRTTCYLNEIKRENWNLDKGDINMHGTIIPVN